MDFFDVVSKFQLELLDADWIEAVHRDDFSKEKDLPPDYELAFDDISLYDLMNYLSVTIKEWIENETESSVSGESEPTAKSWQELINSNFEYKGLIAVLSCFIKLDLKELTTEQSRRCALAASRLYFMLLSINGAQIYNVYNAILFGQAVETLRIVAAMDSSSNVAKPTKRSKKKNQLQAQVPENGEEETRGEDVNPFTRISSHERQRLIQLVCENLRDLHFCFRNVNLSNRTDTLVQTIHVLMSIIRLEKTSSNFFLVKPKIHQSSYLAFKSYQILLLFCDEIHGDPEENFVFIMKSFLPELSLKDVQMNIKLTSVVREHILQFICKCIAEIKEPTHRGVKALIQQLCLRTPDRAESRTKCVQQIFDILNCLPCNLFTWCVLWIVSLSHADGVKNRLTAIELLAKLLSTQERDDQDDDLIVFRQEETEKQGENSDKENENPPEVDGANEHEEVPSTSQHRILNKDSVGRNSASWVSHKVLLSAILSRCLDISPTVRAKCLGIFATLIFSKNYAINDIMQNLFVKPYHHLETIDNVIEEEPQMFNFKKFFSDQKVENWPRKPLPGGTVLMDKMEKLSQDDKVFVRKASILVIMNICKLELKWLTDKRVEILVKACKDMSVLIRKLMTQSLTELLLQDPANEKLQKAWVTGIVPLIADNEIKSQEKVIECSNKHQKMNAWLKARRRNIEDLSTNTDFNVCKDHFTVVGNIVLDNMVKYNLISDHTHYLPWKVINLISNLGMRRLFRFVCRQWETLKRVTPREIDMIRTHIGTENNLPAWFLLVCITEFSTFNRLHFILEYYFNEIHMNPSFHEYCGQLVIECVHLNWRECDKDLVDELCCKLKESLESFSVPYTMVAKAMDIVTMHDPESTKSFASNLIEKCQICIENLFPTNYKKNTKSDLCMAQYIFTLGEAAQICPGIVKNETINLLIDLIDDKYCQDQNEQGVKATSLVKALSVLTLGKLCLQDQFVSKKCVPTLSTLLDKSPPAVKIDTLTTFADLCVRFTSLIEAYLGDMCLCLKDKDHRVRRTTLRLITQLVQEDYIKLKCPIFFYLLCMIVDTDQQIKEDTIAFLINIVLVKSPKVMSQVFVQTLFFFNGFYDNTNHQKIEISSQEKDAFCMTGASNKENRQVIYKFMLEHIADEQKFRVITQTCIEILDKISEDKLPMDANGTALLQDALFSLACEEIRISPAKGGKDEDEEERMLNSQSDGNMQAMLKNNLLNQLMKKVFMETAIPIIMKVKRKLAEMKSVLVSDVMIALRELMKDYKDEIDEIFAGDPEAAAEIALDLKKLETEPAPQEEVNPVMQAMRVMCEKIAEDVILNGGLMISTDEESIMVPGVNGVPPSPEQVQEAIAASSPGKSPPVQNVYRINPLNSTGRSSLNSSEKSSPTGTSKGSAASRGISPPVQNVYRINPLNSTGRSSLNSSGKSSPTGTSKGSPTGNNAMEARKNSSVSPSFTTATNSTKERMSPSFNVSHRTHKSQTLSISYPNRSNSKSLSPSPSPQPSTSSHCSQSSLSTVEEESTQSSEPRRHIKSSPESDDSSAQVKSEPVETKKTAPKKKRSKRKR